MAQLLRNDSAGVMSSLMMDYGDSDEEESGSLAGSRNNSVDDRDKVKEEGEEKMEVVPKTDDDAIVPVIAPIVPALEEQTESLTAFSRRIEINAAPTLPEDEDEKYGDDSPASRVENFISDDEDHHDSVPRPSGEASLFTEPSKDSPSSQTSQPPKKAAMSRLVSYGPDEDLTEDSQSEEEEEEVTQESIETSPEPTTDPSALSRSVQNMKEDDIRIPSEPLGQCSQQLQQKIETMYERMRREGLDLNRIIQNKKTFRNPSIYEKLIDFCHIDQKGTNFPPEIYDPHIWGKESFYDELDKAQRKDMEKREKDKKDRTKVDFVTGIKKGSSGTTDSSMHSDEKKRKTKWDAQPSSGSSQKAPGETRDGKKILSKQFNKEW